MELVNILNSLASVTGKRPEKLSSGTYQCKCPAHDDKKFSLSVTPKDGKILIFCHAGCSYSEVMEAIGNTKENKQKTIKKIYEYKDQDGKLIFQTLRYEPKGFRQRRPDGKGGWIWSVKDVKSVIYNLPNVLESIKNKRIIFITEGEKDADRLNNLGFVATTNPMGAKKWRREYTKQLKNAKVVIVPDQDIPGHKHADLIARLIHKSANEIRILNLPGLSDKGDFSDWIEIPGNDIEKLKELVSSCPKFEPIDEPTSEEISEAFNQNFPKTDLGNSERFFDLHRSYVKFNHSLGSWFFWNGKFWERDQKQRIFKLAKETVRAISAEAVSENNLEERKRLFAHATKSESANAINSMLLLSKSIPQISTISKEYDSDHNLLNVKNGIFDLESFKFLDHERDYCITKMCDAEYYPGAYSELWADFINVVFKKDQELINFVQKAVGISLSGYTDEQYLFFCYGFGANGKSTFFEALKLLLGDYFQKAPTEMILAKNNPSAINNDVARLAGSRLVVASELPSGKRLNEQIIKDLTGGDTITARFLHQEFFEFKPTHKLWMYGNHKPVINDTDEGMWRRVCLVPFKYRIPAKERIPQSMLLDGFRKEMNGILNWCLEGWRKYKEDGLQKPKIVKEETDKYRDDSDVLGSFILECCYSGDNLKCTAKDIYNLYVIWANENKEWRLRKREFLKKMQERGFEKIQGTGNKTMLLGLGLKATQDEMSAAPF